MRLTLLLLAVLVAGCASEKDAPSPTPSGPPIIVPGTPGGPNQTLSSMPSVSETVDADDVTFLRDMMIHHQQAVQMGRLAPTRVSNALVRSLAERIRVGQKPDIDAMRRMLTERGQEPPDLTHAEHADHSGMPGMASPAQLSALQQVTGVQFDRMFLQLMIRHHEGALTMCKAVIDKGSDLLVNQLAAEIQVTQAKEISIMRGLL